MDAPRIYLYGFLLVLYAVRTDAGKLGENLGFEGFRTLEEKQTSRVLP